MKKLLIISLIVFILASILTVNYTMQVSTTFQFEDDNGDDDNGDDDSFSQLKSSTQTSEINNIQNKTYNREYFEKYQSISGWKSNFIEDKNN